MADVWSDDPDRTTRRGDTRTSEQVMADVFGLCEFFMIYPEHPGNRNNHSADRVTVWHGTDKPWHLCGYHASMI